jgi:hypothetical protein
MYLRRHRKSKHPACADMPAVLPGEPAMSDLIWIGNTLLPRWFVFWAIGIFVVLCVGAFVILTDDRGR